MNPPSCSIACAGVRRAALLLAVAVLLLAGCDSPARRQKQARLDALNAQSDRIQQTLSDQQSDLADMMQRLTAQRSQLEACNGEVQGYMLDHKMAVAAIAAGADGAVNSDGAYSKQVEELGAGLDQLAAVWARKHGDEVRDVVKNLNQASAAVRVLHAAITQDSSAIAQQQAMIRQSRDRLDAVARQIEQLRTETARAQPGIAQPVAPAIAS